MRLFQSVEEEPDLRGRWKADPIFPSIVQAIQTRHVIVIVESDPKAIEKILWTRADGQFDQFNLTDLASIIASIGTAHTYRPPGPFSLTPIVPKSKSEFL